MHVQVELIRDQIIPKPFSESSGQAGAWVEFTGVVRGTENGKPIAALEYEAYETMAVNIAQKILDRLMKAHPCLYAHVIHRLGVIPVGEAAIWIGVAAAHRGEALALATAFMDELKQDVPIWKYRAIPLGSDQAPT